jgi:hypothetical protein
MPVGNLLSPRTWSAASFVLNLSDYRTAGKDCQDPIVYFYKKSEKIPSAFHSILRA